MRPLLDHVRELHERFPDQPLPRGASPFSDNCRHEHHDEDVTAAKAVLREYADNPALTPHDLHERCAELGVHGYEFRDFETTPRLLDAARWLIRHGTSRHAVGLGLGLLHGHAEPADVPVVRTLGLLDFAAKVAAETLLVLGAVHDVIWLSERSNRYPRRLATKALVAHPDPDVRRWVRAVPSPRGELARAIAEEHGLLDLLAVPDDELWDQAGTLLLAMTTSVHHGYQITWYRDAAEAFQRWVGHAHERPPTVDRAAKLALVAQSLSSEAAALVTVEIRADLITRINAVLTTWRLRPANPAEARRLQWISDQPTRNRVPRSRFALQVAVPDPAGPGMVELRPLVNGMPIIPEAFDKRAGEEPEVLIPLLRTTGEIRLAESYCDEICSGALYVTIVREAGEVVWRTGELEFRFDAGEYDQELARAEQDRGWEWPARTAARLVRTALETEPEILGRWDCELGAVTAWPGWFDEMGLTFTSQDSGWSIKLTMGERTAEDVAAELIDQLRTADPRLTAKPLWVR